MRDQQGLAYACVLPWFSLVAGAIIALVGISRYAPTSLNDSEAARVNEYSITRSEWQRAIGAANSSRRTPLDHAEESALLQKLIDEELLIQLALNLELAHGIPEVRSRLVQAAMESLSQDGTHDVTDEDLERFVADNPQLFHQPERRRIHVQRWPRAETEADSHPIDLPPEALTQRQLQRWLGHQLSDLAFKAPETGVIEQTPAVGEGFYRIEVLAIEAARQLHFDDIPRDLVTGTYQRTMREAALQSGLTHLRKQARILSANDHR